MKNGHKKEKKLKVKGIRGRKREKEETRRGEKTGAKHKKEETRLKKRN